MGTQRDAPSMLFLMNDYPWPLYNGGVQRAYYQLEAFSTRYRLTLVACRRGGTTDAERTPLHDRGVRVLTVDYSDVADRPGGSYGVWRPLGQQLRDLVTPGLPINVQRWWSDTLVARLRELRDSSHFDVVWAVRSAPAEMAKRAGWSNIIVDLPDLDIEAARRSLQPLGWYKKRPLHAIDLMRLERYERSLPARFAHVVVCKEEDRTFMGASANVSVVPNGTVLRPAVDPALARAHEMLFVGSMGYDPNVDAVTWFMRDIMPAIVQQRPNARLAIVGKEAAPEVLRLHDDRICVVHGAVPEVTPYYASAGIVVVPIRHGAGTRLKVLEALMLGKAVVATTMAIEGLDLRVGTDVEVADTADAFARACVGLMQDEARRRQLAEAGRARVIELYQWTRINEMASEVVARTLAAGAVRRTEQRVAPVSPVVG